MGVEEYKPGIELKGDTKKEKSISCSKQDSD